MPSSSPVVLIVDDHEDSAAMYAVALRAMGFQPATARTAEDGFAEASRSQPDVVVADMTLTGASGLDLIRQLRADARTKDAAILVLTGHAEKDARQEAYQAGCDRFVLKPCLPDALAVEIRDVLLARGAASDNVPH